MKAEIFFDGGARPNPGHAAFGVLVRFEDGYQLEIGRYIGIKSNNTAEFIGLIVGLKVAYREGAKEVVITGDSKLVIGQVTGEWVCKADHLRPLCRQAQMLVDRFESVEWVHVRGHGDNADNNRVDELCTNAILKGRANPFTRKAGIEGEIVDPFK